MDELRKAIIILLKAWDEWCDTDDLLPSEQMLNALETLDHEAAEFFGDSVTEREL